MFVKIFFLSLAIYQVSAMAGGANTAIGAYPSLVGVVWSLNNQVCGGVVLNRNHVLTVANCMLNAQNLLIAANQIGIMSSTNTVNFALPRIPALAIYVHPQYNPFTFENDIAIVRTNGDFNFPVVPVPVLIEPVVISNRIAFDTMACQLVAWNTGNNQQQVLTVPIVNRDTCNALPPNFGRISESQICAGILNTGSGACVINRGGGLYCNGMLEGLLSSGFSCGTVANTPGVYTQLRFYSQWIEEQMSRQDIPPANSSPIERLP